MDFYFGRLSGNSTRSAFALYFSSTPNIRAWLERLWARPAWKKATEMAVGGGTGR